MLSLEEQSRIRDAVARVALRATAAIKSRSSASQAIQFIDILHANIDRTVDAENRAGPEPACKPGCAHCCALRVEVTDAEALRIAAHVRTLPPATVESLSAQLQHNLHVHGQRPLPLPLPASVRTPCAFLADRLCSIYAIRPAVCRKGHSLSVVACEAHAPEIPQNLSLLLKCETLIEGAKQGYRTNKLPAETSELSAAVMAALSSPAASDSWYRGVPVLSPPDRTDGEATPSPTGLTWPAHVRPEPAAAIPQSESPP